MRRFIHWFFYLSLLSLFGMLSFHAHAQTSSCRTTRDQWVVQVPYAIGVCARHGGLDADICADTVYRGGFLQL